MQHIVMMMILHVMENLVFLMLNIQHVVSFIKYSENMNDAIYLSLGVFDHSFLVNIIYHAFFPIVL